MAITFKGILKTVLIGGGSILAALCPPVGGAVITAGMAIGTGAAVAGSLIKTDQTVSVDNVTTAVNDFLVKTGLTGPATTGGTKLTTTAWLMIIGVIGVIFLLIAKPFKRRRR